MKKFIALGLGIVFSVSVLEATQQDFLNSQTFLRFETPFQTASPERVALFVTEDAREKHRAAHNGDVQFVVFGGENSNQASAAAYYLPGGYETLTFNASVSAANGGTDTLLQYWNGVQGGFSQYATLDATAGLGNAGPNLGLGFATGTGTAGTAFTIANATAAANLTTNTGTGTNVTAITQANYTANTPAVNDLVVGSGVAGVYEGLIVNSADSTGATAGTGITGIVSNTALANGSVNNAAIGSFPIDSNKNVSILRPWNFGVGYAPNIALGVSLSESQFVSTITPELKRSHWGIGATWKQILSEKDTGWFLELSTAMQRVTMNFELNEAVTEALVLNPTTNQTNATDAGAANVLWASSWATTPVNSGYDTGDTTPPTTITEAFAQSAWSYGKIDGAQSITRLADIELKLGYQFICEDNIMSNMFFGIVIPTGNKAQSIYLAEPIVGNGFHFGIMLGTTQEIQLDWGTETRWSLRSDSNFRYLFKNTQVRSFDTLSNGQWSRYMMVWPSYAAEQEYGEVGAPALLREFTPGINVFTQEVNVTPRAQARTNQAIVVESGSFKGEFGWNMLVRQAEQVSLVNDWVDNSVAFVDASSYSVSLFNATRTIYNDSYQSSPVVNGGLGGVGIAGDSQTQYNAASISSTDLNINSAASEAAFTNTPYLALGYAFNEEKSSVFSLGFSYELSATNSYINDWTLWGKFGFSF